MEQISIFEYFNDPRGRIYKITKPIRLIEAFGGIGSQAMALRDLGADFETWKLFEYDKYPIDSYNAIHGTNYEPTDIRNVHGKDLEIVDKESFTYLLTYTFPCQDLSVSGLMKGMSKGSQTRSGLLWEIERILSELPKEQLPDVLLMENVPNVHGAANMRDFQKWLDFLTSLGYSNHYKDLNAKDYGVAQSRSRCFCVSILGEWNYKFPKPIKLNKTMKDYLEDKVDEKYYINTEKAKELIDKLILNGKILTDRQTDRPSICTQKSLTSQTQSQRINAEYQSEMAKSRECVKSLGFLTDKNHQSTEVYDQDGLSRCLQATDNKHGQKVVVWNKL